MKFHNPKYPYDPQIKVGNLVRYTYGGDKGFWKVTKIDERDYANPLFTLERLFDNCGHNAKKTTIHCNAARCKKVTQATVNEICTSGAKMFEDMKTKLTKYLDEQNGQESI